MKIELDNRSPQLAANVKSDQMMLFHGTTHIKEEMKTLRQLEGECKIKEWQYLAINYPKAIFFALLMMASVVGLLLLKYYKSLRAVLFYSKIMDRQFEQATDIYVLTEDGTEDICCIYESRTESGSIRMFEFIHLKYKIHEHEPVPLALAYHKNLQNYTNQTFLQKGLKQTDIKRREQFYGKNEHKVQVPNYFQFLFDTMTQPFFIFQYAVSTIYILQNLGMFGGLMIGFSWFTTSINYLLLYRSYSKIKQSAEKEYTVSVLRNGIFQDVKNTELVPGDLYKPRGEVPCDSIIVKGELFVDQASLTGQNVPIAKFKWRNGQTCDDSQYWIYQGSKIQTTKDETLALAVHVGYTSRRGRIIRKILTKTNQHPQFFRKLIYFMIEQCLVVLIVFVCALPLLLSIQIQKVMVIFKFLDYITYAFPAPYPIYFNLAYSFCLVRLNRDGIVGTDCQKTIIGGRMKTLCFDKTGTLTNNKMKICSIYNIKSQNEIQDVTTNASELIMGLFGCCNSVEMINGEVKGDEIDLRMFQQSEGSIQISSEQGVVRSIVQGDSRWEVLKINQYESKFQSMSVLARNTASNKYYIFVKGSPQMIHSSSTLKYKQYDAFVKKLSLEGYRSIGFGYREVPQSDLNRLGDLDRSEWLKGTKILGVVSFVNPIKADAKETISILTECDISTKIITGDNIYLGVQTAFMTGMVPLNCNMLILQGKRYDPESNSAIVVTLSRNNLEQFTETTTKIDSFAFYDDPGLVYAVDNDLITMMPGFFHHRIKVFARITPQNKALIVRKYKEIYYEQRNNRSICQKIVGQCGYTVGMVGDGANDLIAIKEADVGIAIASSDAVYSAAFAVSELMQIDEVIRQAKNTQRQIIEIVQFYGVAQYLPLTIGLILTKECAYMNALQLVYRNFALMIIVPIFYGLSRPASKLTKYLAETNFMGVENHLVFWGNYLIWTVGMVASYEYNLNTDGFYANATCAVTFAKGYVGRSQSITIMFDTKILALIFMAVTVYRSNPWKQSIYKNIPLTALLILNFIVMFLLFFGTDKLSTMYMYPMENKKMGVIMVIMLVTAAVNWLFNYWVQRQKYHERHTSNRVGNQNVSEVFEITKTTT